jgi:hypothetical protein
MLPLSFARSSKSSSRRVQISAIGRAVFLICLALGVVPAIHYNNPVPVVIALVIGLYFLFAIRVAEQWEKAEARSPGARRLKSGRPCRMGLRRRTRKVSLIAT